MDQRWDLLLTNATVATLNGESGYGLIEAGGIGIDGGRIVWVGDLRELPGDPVQLASQRRSLGGALVTPGLIDCHTHLVFAGDRADEFEKRLNGVSYEEIARAGGGIRSTVTRTRAASEEELFDASVVRARALLAEGVTTLEIKSGYGLDLDSERRMLKVARRIGRVLGIQVRTTFLGAHTLPQEFAGRADDYVAHLADAVLPQLAEEGLVDAVDGFCEKIAFSVGQMRRIFERATALSLPVKLHAEQLSNSHGAALVAEFGGLSADHLEYLDDAGIAAMAEAGTVAVILPGSFYCLRETRQPPIAALRAAGVPMAVSTDLNPGTSPLLSLRLAMNQSSILFRMTPDEALRGTTINAARALGLSTTKGRIAPGNDADLAIWNLKHPAELSYWVGGNPLRETIVAGRTVRAAAADFAARNP